MWPSIRTRYISLRTRRRGSEIAASICPTRSSKHTLLHVHKLVSPQIYRYTLIENSVWLNKCQGTIKSAIAIATKRTRNERTSLRLSLQRPTPAYSTPIHRILDASATKLFRPQYGKHMIGPAPSRTRVPAESHDRASGYVEDATQLLWVVVPPALLRSTPAIRSHLQREEGARESRRKRRRGMTKSAKVRLPHEKRSPEKSPALLKHIFYSRASRSGDGRERKIKAGGCLTRVTV